MMNLHKNKNGFTQHHLSGKSGAGFTVVELLVASSLFIVLISVASGAFIQTLRNQRVVTRLSESMNNTAFVMEQIAREVRVGFSFSVSSGGGRLQFVNSDGDNVSYALSGGGIERCENANCKIITAPDVEIDNVEFILQGESAGDGEPPRVTILLSVVGGSEIRVPLQTTISARIIDT